MLKYLLKISAVLFVVCFVSFPLMAAQAQQGKTKTSLNDVLAKMEQVNSKMQDMQFDYVQRLKYTDIDEEQSAQGQIKYKDRNHICIYQKAPQEQYIYVDGSKITTYVPDNKQAIVENWKNLLNNDELLMTIIDFNKNWKAFKKNHIIELNNETQTAYVLVVKSKNPKLNWTMYLDLNKDTFLLDSAIYSNKNYTINISLTDYYIDNNFADDVFKFVPSEDTDIIDF